MIASTSLSADRDQHARRDLRSVDQENARAAGGELLVARHQLAGQRDVGAAVCPEMMAMITKNDERSTGAGMAWKAAREQA
jgi:hypothetical protein